MSQTRVDFYLLNDSKAKEALGFACRLLEKAYLKGHQIFVFCEKKEQAISLDESLWTFHPTSFIPHRILENTHQASEVPIQISTEEPQARFKDILLNLSSKIPENFSQFERILEIVLENEQSKEISRAHYRTYKKHKLALKTHFI